MRQAETAEFHRYLPIDDALFHSAVYVTSAGRGRIPPGQDYPPSGHPALYQFTWSEGRVLPEFSLIFVTGGRGVVETRPGRPTAVPDGSVILLMPGVWHRYRPERATGWTERWVQFNGRLAHQLLDEGDFVENRAVLTPAAPDLFTRQLDHLLDAIQSLPTRNSKSWSLQVLGLLAQLIPDETGPPKLVPQCGQDAAVATALALIWNHSHRALGVPEVAARVGVNRRTLERRFRAELGHSVLEEIVRCRCNRAARLLRETKLPIKRIVDLAGFGSAANLRQVFQKRLRRAPARYREERG